MAPRQENLAEDRAASAAPARVVELDYLRGLAILGVIAVHTSANAVRLPGIPPLVIANIIVDVVAHYAVPLFVLLSGIALALRYGGAASSTHWGDFYRRRLKTIVPPYLVFSAIYYILVAVRYGAPSLRVTLLQFLTGSVYYHLWFVVMLIQLYLLFPLLLLLLGWAAARGRLAWVLVAALLLQWAWNIGTLYLLDALPATVFWQTVLSYRVFLSHILYFVIGMVAGLGWPAFRARLKRMPAWPAAVIAGALALVTVAVWVTAITTYGSLAVAPQRHFASAMLVEPALYLSIAALLWKAVARLRPAARPASFLTALGALSLGIYLIHVLFQVLLVGLFERVGIAYADWLFYPLLFAGALGLSYVSVALLTRLPFAEYVVGVRRRGPDAV